MIHAMSVGIIPQVHCRRYRPHSELISISAGIFSASAKYNSDLSFVYKDSCVAPIFFLSFIQIPNFLPLCQAFVLYIATNL